MNKKELEIFSLACTFLKLRGFQFYNEMFDILDKMSRQRQARVETTIKRTKAKREINKDYARSKKELEKRKNKNN